MYCSDTAHINRARLVWAIHGALTTHDPLQRQYNEGIRDKRLATSRICIQVREQCMDACSSSFYFAIIKGSASGTSVFRMEIQKKREHNH